MGALKRNVLIEKASIAIEIYMRGDEGLLLKGMPHCDNYVLYCDNKTLVVLKGGRDSCIEAYAVLRSKSHGKAVLVKCATMDIGDVYVAKGWMIWQCVPESFSDGLVNFLREMADSFRSVVKTYEGINMRTIDMHKRIYHNRLEASGLLRVFKPGVSEYPELYQFL